MRIFVAIPAYDGKVCVETLDSLLGEVLLGFSQQHVIDVRVLPGCSAIAAARNSLVQDFIESDYDRLFFLDADIGFTPGDIVKVCENPHDLVGGAYRYKREEEAYAVHWDDNDLWSDETGAIPVRGLGTGFLAISRDCLAKVREKYGPRTYSDGEREVYAYFDMPVDGMLWGEDLRFCHMAKESGVTCYVLPEMTLTHVGGKQYVGHLGGWLRNRTAQ